MYKNILILLHKNTLHPPDLKVSKNESAMNEIKLNLYRKKFMCDVMEANEKKLQDLILISFNFLPGMNRKCLREEFMPSLLEKINCDRLNIVVIMRFLWKIESNMNFMDF